MEDKRRMQQKMDKERKKESKDATGMQVDGEDLSAMDDEASNRGQEAIMTSGKHRFDTLIKTMIARIEYNNTLAPVQEYGRHQMQAKKKKKGK